MRHPHRKYNGIILLAGNCKLYQSSINTQKRIQSEEFEKIYPYPSRGNQLDDIAIIVLVHKLLHKLCNITYDSVSLYD